MAPIGYKVKTEVFPCLPNYLAMKTYGEWMYGATYSYSQD
jgi:hypothetical protein